MPRAKGFAYSAVPNNCTVWNNRRSYYIGLFEHVFFNFFWKKNNNRACTVIRDTRVCIFYIFLHQKLALKLGFQTLDFRYIILKINPTSVLYFFHLDETCLYSHKYSQSNLDMIWQLSYQFEYKLISSVTVSQKLLF